MISVKDFKKTLDTLYAQQNKLLENKPFSFYSLIPFIDRLPNVKEKTFSEKLELKEEIKDLLVPCLLGESGDYLSGFLEDSLVSDFKPFVSDTKQKFLALKEFFDLSKFSGGNFCHIGHYGTETDIKIPARCFTSELRKYWLNLFYPQVFEVHLEDIKKQAVVSHIVGWIILINSSAETFLRNGKLKDKKISLSVQLSKKLGASIIGMGGLIGSFTKGGYQLAENFKNLSFTTGHSYTVANILDILFLALKRYKKIESEQTIAIVGAAGSIGSGCAKILANHSFKKMILVDSSSMLSWEKLQNLECLLKSNTSSNVDLVLTTKIDDIREADIVIVATNSPFSIISSSNLKENAILIDDSFPKNVSQELVSFRKDVIFLEGGAINFPNDFIISAPEPLPSLSEAPLNRLISHKYGYSSFSETIILSFFSQKENYTLGSGNISLINDIRYKAKTLGITPKMLECYGEEIN